MVAHFMYKAVTVDLTLLVTFNCLNFVILLLNWKKKETELLGAIGNGKGSGFFFGKDVNMCR